MSLSVNSAEDDRSPLLSSYNPDESFRGPTPRPLLETGASEGRLRHPVNYQSTSNSSSSHDRETSAVVSRYKYYSKLAPHSESTFTMPDHVVPGIFIITEITQIQGSQSSLITIFSLWNTMMGTSLLSMPWAINQAGFTCGILLLLAMAALMLYTSYRILHSVRGITSTSDVVEFSDVCRQYLGRWAEVVAFISSLLTLLGGMIVYWILLSNFLYNIVTFIYHNAQGGGNSTSGSTDPTCPSKTSDSGHNNTSQNITFWTSNHTNNATFYRLLDDQKTDQPHNAFSRWWDEQKTVPLMLVAVLLPLINFKSPTFFTKFNALGTISVTYLVCFAMKNAISWGIHMDFNDTTSPVYVHEYKNSFAALTGVAALAYFVQNCVLSITRAQKIKNIFLVKQKSYLGLGKFTRGEIPQLAGTINNLKEILSNLKDGQMHFRNSSEYRFNDSKFTSTFPALTGISALAYFVHNCVLAVTRLQEHPENTVRDLVIAYVLVAVTYIYMGVIVYISFGLDKNCIEDNFLNNLKDTNVMAFVARIGLFFQMVCVFPLLVFIFRLQFMNSLFGTIWPSLTHVLVLNIVLVGVCVIFAVFLPHIGKIIGFVGAFCGFSYAIALPCLVYMRIRYEQQTLTVPIIIVHSIFIVLGFANFIGQFLLLG